MPVLGENVYDLLKGERENCKTGKQTHREKKFSQLIQQIPVSQTRNRESTKNIWKQSLSVEDLRMLLHVQAQHSY